MPLGAPRRQQRNAQDGQCHSQDELQDTMGPSPLYASCAQAARKELEMPPRCCCSLLMLTDGCPVVQSSPAACLGISPHSTVSHRLLHPQLCHIAQLTSTVPCSTAEVTHCSPLPSLLSAPLPSLSTALLPTAQLKTVFPTAHFNPAASSTAYLTPTALHSTAHPTGSTLSLCPSPPKLLPIAHFTGSAVCQLPTSLISLSSEWLRDNTAPHFLPPRSTAPLNVLTAGT